MKCELTPELVVDSLDPECLPARREALQEHAQSCHVCKVALGDAQQVAGLLGQWRKQPTPDWERAAVAAAAPLRRGGIGRKLRTSPAAWLQWGPLAASLVIALAVILQVRIDVGANGLSLSFGVPPDAAVASDLSAQLAVFAAQQREDTRLMMETALAQFGEHTTDTWMQLVEFFEQQRELDLRIMESSFQQVLDRSYQTVNSVQQLASYIQFQESHGAAQ
jgi:predicted anti-sigma-YlaC factor YlaD